jgi:hypothetical protein
VKQLSEALGERYFKPSGILLSETMSHVNGFDTHTPHYNVDFLLTFPNA